MNHTASLGAIKVKPFTGKRRDTTAAISRKAPAAPKATQWVPKVS
jgi:hypothetical protein